MSTVRKKTTIYVDPDLLRAIKVLAASSVRHDDEVIEEALRDYVDAAIAEARRRAFPQLLEDIDESQSESLRDDDALALAYAELDAMRDERRVAVDDHCRDGSGVDAPGP